MAFCVLNSNSYFSSMFWSFSEHFWLISRWYFFVGCGCCCCCVLRPRRQGLTLWQLSFLSLANASQIGVNYQELLYSKVVPFK